MATKMKRSGSLPAVDYSSSSSCSSPPSRLECEGSCKAEIQTRLEQAELMALEIKSKSNSLEEIEMRRCRWEVSLRHEHELSAEKARIAEEKMQHAESILADVEYREKSLRNLQSRSLRIKEDHFRLESTKADLLKHQERLEEEQVRWKRERGTIEELHVELEHKAEMLHRAEDRLKIFGDIEATKAKAEERLAEMREMDQELREREAKLADLEAERKILMRRTREVEDLEAKAKKQFSSSFKAHKEHIEAARSYRDLKAKMLTNLEKLQEERSQFEHLQRDIADLNCARQQLEDQVVSLQARERKCKQSEQEISIREKFVSQKEVDLVARENEIVAKESDIETKSKEIRDLEEALRGEGSRVHVDLVKLQNIQQEVKRDKALVLEKEASVNRTSAEVAAREEKLKTGEAHIQAQQQELGEHIRLWHQEQADLKREAEDTLRQLRSDRDRERASRESAEALEKRRLELVEELERSSSSSNKKLAELHRNEIEIKGKTRSLEIETSRIEELRREVEERASRLDRREEDLRAIQIKSQKEEEDLERRKQEHESEVMLWRDADSALRLETQALTQKNSEVSERERMLEQRELELSDFEERLKAYEDGLQKQRAEIEEKIGQTELEKRNILRNKKTAREQLRKLATDLRLKKEALQSKVAAYQKDAENLQRERKDFEGRLGDFERREGKVERASEIVKKKLKLLKEQEQTLRNEKGRLVEEAKQVAMSKSRNREAASEVAKRLEKYGEELHKRLQGALNQHERKEERDPVIIGIVNELKDLREAQQKTWRRELCEVEKNQRMMEERLLAETKELSQRQSRELAEFHENVSRMQQTEQDHLLKKLEIMVAGKTSAEADDVQQKAVKFLDTERQRLEQRQAEEREHLEEERHALQLKIEEEWELIHEERQKALQREEDIVAKLKNEFANKRPATSEVDTAVQNAIENLMNEKAALQEEVELQKERNERERRLLEDERVLLKQEFAKYQEEIDARLRREREQLLESPQKEDLENVEEDKEALVPERQPTPVPMPAIQESQTVTPLLVARARTAREEIAKQILEKEDFEHRLDAEGQSDVENTNEEEEWDNEEEEEQNAIENADVVEPIEEQHAKIQEGDDSEEEEISRDLAQQEDFDSQEVRSNVRRSELNQIDSFDMQLSTILAGLEGNISRLKRLNNILAPMKSAHLTDDIGDEVMELSKGAVEAQSKLFKLREELLGDDRVQLGEYRIAELEGLLNEFHQRRNNIEDRFQDLMRESSKLIHLQHEKEGLYSSGRPAASVSIFEDEMDSDDELAILPYAAEDPSSYQGKMQNCMQMLEKSLKTREKLLLRDNTMTPPDIRRELSNGGFGGNRKDLFSLNRSPESEPPLAKEDEGGEEEEEEDDDDDEDDEDEFEFSDSDDDDNDDSDENSESSDGEEDDDDSSESRDDDGEIHSRTPERTTPSNTAFVFTPASKKGISPPVFLSETSTIPKKALSPEEDQARTKLTLKLQRISLDIAALEGDDNPHNEDQTKNNDGSPGPELANLKAEWEHVRAQLLLLQQDV